MKKFIIYQVFRFTLWTLTGLTLLGLIWFEAIWNFRPNSLQDYGSFYASGKAALLGKNPYDTGMPSILRLTAVRYTLIDWEPVAQEYSVQAVNLNPPISIPIASLAAQDDPWVGMFIWRVATIMTYILAILMLALAFPKDNKPLWILWALSLAGFWHTIELGQIYTPLLLLVVGALIAHKHQHLAISGICLGLVVAMKPNFAVWLLFLLVAKHYRLFLVAFITASGLSLVPAILYGPQIYLHWLEASAKFTGMALPANNSLPGLFVRFGTPSIGLVLGALLVAGGLILIRWKKLDGYTVHHLGILVSLLASPIAWTGYTMLAIPVLWMKKTSFITLAVAVIFAVPFVTITDLFTRSYFHFILFGWWYGWALLILCYDCFHRSVVNLEEVAPLQPQILGLSQIS
jgi:hypothetical protein